MFDSFNRMVSASDSVSISFTNDSIIYMIDSEFKLTEHSLNSESNDGISINKEKGIPLIIKGNDDYRSSDINRTRMDDWYFVIIIVILILMAWIRIMYDKFLIVLFESSYNYLLASKTFKERNIVRKRFDLILDVLYILNGALFILLLYRFFERELPVTGNFKIFIMSVILLVSIMIYRNIIMRITGFIFNRITLFSECLYHYFIYNKIIGIGLLPFIIFIPYTKDLIHEILIITALSMVGLLYIMRFIRLIIFTSKNVVLYFYLILYLCTLEILPVLVIIKIILSLR